MPWRCNRVRAAWRKRRRQTDPGYVRRRLTARARQRRHRRLLPALMANSGGICPICGYSLPDGVTGAVHVDHIVPRCQGGADTLDNLQATHADCNIRKGVA